MTATHAHPDFGNVIRVARFHQAPQRIQYLIEPGPNVLVLPLLWPPRKRRRPIIEKPMPPPTDSEAAG